MPSTLGTQTPLSILLQGFSGELTHVEFEASGTIMKGAPVKLHTNGTIRAIASGDAAGLRMGVAMHAAVSGENVTVCTRGLGVTIGIADAVQNAGIVKVTGGTSPHTEYGAATNTTDMHGWALDAAAAIGDQIRVLQGM